MYPVLFEYDEDFSGMLTGYDLLTHTNGLGVLFDCVSCIVEEKRNGIFELEMEYPAKGIHAEKITKGRQIVCLPNPLTSFQSFKIDRIKKTLYGTIEVHANHISYLLTGYFFNFGNALREWYDNAELNPPPYDMGSTSPWHNWPADFGTSQRAGYELQPLCGMLTQNIAEFYGGKFSVTSSGFSSGSNTRPLFNKKAKCTSIRNAMHGEEGSLLDIFGGTWKWNMFRCTLMKERGSDKNFTIRYGWNLESIDYEESSANDYTGYFAYIADQDETSWSGGLVELDEDVPAWLQNDYFMDCNDLMTQEEIDNNDFTKMYVRAAINANKLGLGLPASKTSFEYEELSEGSEYVGIGDTVHMYCEPLDISYTAKVTGTRYNVLLERYDEIQIGQNSSDWSIGQSVPNSSGSGGLNSDAVQEMINNSITTTGERNIIIVADSYGDKVYSGDDANGVVFQDVFRTICPPNWSVYTVVQSGASFLGLSDNTNLKFINVLQSVTGVSSDVGITDVVVVGGWNDVDNLASGSTVANLRTAIKEFCDYCTEKYPNASVLLCPVGTELGNTTKRIAYRNMLDCYTKPVNARFSAMQDADCVLTSTTFFRAGQWVHPNDAGGEAIATALLNTLSGQGVGIHRQWWNAVSGGAGDLSGVVESIGSQISTLNSAFYQYQNGREVTLLMFNTAITTTGGKAWGGNPSQFQNICTLKDPIFVGSQYGDFQTVVPVLVQDTSNKWHDLTGILRLNGKKVQLSLQNITSSGYTLINTKWLGIAGNTVIHGDAGLCNL